MSRLLNLALAPFALAAVGLTRFISRWRLVRFGVLWHSRLGHLIGNTECYLCERDAGLHPKAFDIFIRADGKSANRVIEAKYRKLLHLWPRRFGSLVYQMNTSFAGWEKHVAQSVQLDRDVKGLWEKHAPHIGLTEREEAKGGKLLDTLGIPRDAKWVCLIVRDGAYLKKQFPRADYSYHDYRDADISDYVPAATALVARGYYVIRMGNVMAKPFHVKHSRIVDYAFHKPTDFATLYLGAKCAFSMGTPTGFMAIAQAFNRPLCVTDMMPLALAPTWCRGLMIFKHHVKDGRRMGLREIFDTDLATAQFAQLFALAGVKLENNSPKELHDVAMEMADRFERNDFDGERQEAFWSNFPAMMAGGAPLNEVIRLRIGEAFLRSYQ